VSALDRACELVAARRGPIVLVGGRLAYRVAARIRPLGLVATTLDFPRCAPAPEDFDACPILLAHPGGDGIARSRRFFDRLAVRKRMVIGACDDAIAAFVRDLQRRS